MRFSLTVIFGVCSTILYIATSVQSSQLDSKTIESGDLPVSWRPAGPNCIEVPDWEVHQFNSNLFILRESGCTNYEKPFLYLIFGNEKALLLDTGAGPAKTSDIVSKVMTSWMETNKRTKMPLLVTHTHRHGDHIAGDPQFRNKKDVELIEPTVEAAKIAFGISQWPDSAGFIDLGERMIAVIPIPGHQEASLAFYDRRTGILFTGDSPYPGRLYIADWLAFTASIQRLVSFTADKSISYILGCHIEQSRQPFVDYPVGTVYQPMEHELALGRAHLLELNEALRNSRNTPARIAYRDFTVWPKQPTKSVGQTK